MTSSAVLPRLGGSRSAARRVIEALGPVKGALIVIDCRELQSAAPSYADELVKVALVEQNAASVTLKDASAEFESYVRDSLKARELDPSRLDTIHMSR